MFSETRFAEPSFGEEVCVQLETQQAVQETNAPGGIALCGEGLRSEKVEREPTPEFGFWTLFPYPLFLNPMPSMTPSKRPSRPGVFSSSLRLRHQPFLIAFLLRQKGG